MTGLESRVLLQFVDGTRTTLGAQTTYRIDTYDWQPAAKSTAVYELVKGVFKTVTGAITRTESHYQVNTPIGSIGIRGTEFWGGYLVPDKVDVLFISGDSIIDVSNRFGTISLLEPGLGTTLSANKAPTEPKRWPQAKVGKAVNTVYWPELYEPPF
jgi:hypothetical protein